MMALEADRLSFSYGEAPVLSCASFGLPQGGFAALIGPNRRREKHAVKTAAGGALPQQRRRAAAGPGYGPVSELEKAGLCAPGRAGPPYRFSRLRGGGRSGQPVRGDRPVPLPEAGAPGAGAAGPGIGGNGRLWAPADWSPVRRAAPAGVAGQGSDLPPGGHAAGRAHLRHGPAKRGGTFTACWPG